jgi:transposase
VRRRRSFLAPKWLPELRELLELLHADVHNVARHLDVSERTVYHWLKTGKPPRAALLALWFETHEAYDVVNDKATYLLSLKSRLADSLERENATLRTRIARLEALGQFGSANSPVWAQR